MARRSAARWQLAAMMAVSAVLTLAVAGPVTANHGDPGHLVPFRASITTHDPPDGSYLPPSCEGGAWDFATTGSGVVTHLGRVAWQQTHCTRVDFQAGEGWVEDGQAIMTAANGDMLVVSYDVTFTFDERYSYLTIQSWEVTGGTGRFAGATGSGTGVGMGDYAVDFITHSEWVGSISYDAAG